MPSESGRMFGYGRVSTRDQNSESQRLELERAHYLIHPRRWFADTISGKSAAAQRPQFSRLLDRIEEGDTLVVSKLDRLGRDSLDVERTLSELEGRGVSVVVLQLGRVDLTSTAGRLIRKVLGAVAEMERDLLVERTQAGLQRAKASGKRLGRPAKTSPSQRADIRARSARGTSVSEIARCYKISRATVSTIIRAAQTEHESSALDRKCATGCKDGVA